MKIYHYSKWKVLWKMLIELENLQLFHKKLKLKMKKNDTEN